MNDKIERTVRQVVSLLVDGEYEKLAWLTNNTRLRAEHIRDAVSEYPGTLVMPPESAFNRIDMIAIKGPPPPQWSIRFDLWTLEGSRSDLSIEMTLIDSNGELAAIELDDIHVL